MIDPASNLTDLVKSKSEESAAYFRQWLVWLGVGSAGGAVALASLAAHLPDPNYAFRLIIPSLWMFLLGVILAGSSVLAFSRKLSAMGEHFANAHNRDEIGKVIGGMPHIISAPRSIADNQNAERNKYIEQHDRFHELAEKSWKVQTFWSRVLMVCSSTSALLFVAGMAVPLAQITLGKSLKP